MLHRVQIHDSYKFDAKSYHSMQYHFRSIDTWLTGVCKSYCSQHSWRKSRYVPGQKSVFALDDVDDDQDQPAEDELDQEDIYKQISSINHQSNKVKEMVGETASSAKKVLSISETIGCSRDQQFVDANSTYSHGADSSSETDKRGNDGEPAASGMVDATIPSVSDNPSLDCDYLEHDNNAPLCLCPECLSSDCCVHLNADSSSSEHQLSSSLECFEIIDDAQHYWSGFQDSVLSCPSNNTGRRSKSRKSVSPTKTGSEGGGKVNRNMTDCEFRTSTNFQQLKGLV